MRNGRPSVYLIGGAPGAGKTTLGCALAARLNGSSVTIDDLVTVAQAGTTRQQHPDLYLMESGDHVSYFTNSSIEKLIDDANRQHAAVWPYVKRVIEKRVVRTSRPIVIDGWHLRPQRIAELGAEQVASVWLHIDESVLEARERTDTAFYGQSHDPQQMLQNFLARSFWINKAVRDDARQLSFPVLHQDGQRSVDELTQETLREFGLTTPERAN